ncbi:Rieske (2Fe-2S) protein [Halocatena salina]|uniref:Rieske 2Fe-2S domain-containing protein n=1 Tax=Halocatena salina TaxID=2934340 RepID=A0A8T9ZYY5_9EURY|nr:Rieske 2Fe-2S domain-containing protein [Halocatena salina]UPM41962.1 Rieske 2Fe-2S domain-containing protein [Halocatena salina]
MTAGERIASVSEVPDDTTVLFTVRETATDERKEGILVRSNGTVIGWLNYCQHFTHIRLDKGSGAELRDSEIVCTNHGAMFDADTGQCTYGPCDGAYLHTLDVTSEDGAVYLTDDEYEFVALGPAETDDLDLTSTSNVEF